MADSIEDGTNGASFSVAQEISSEMAVSLHVADDWLDGDVRAKFVPYRRGDAAFPPADEAAGSLGIVAAIVSIDVGAAQAVSRVISGEDLKYRSAPAPIEWSMRPRADPLGLAQRAAGRGLVAIVELRDRFGLRDLKPHTETTVTEQGMALIELVAKQTNGGLVLAMLAVGAERIMEAEVDALTGAAKSDV